MSEKDAQLVQEIAKEMKEQLMEDFRAKMLSLFKWGIGTFLVMLAIYLGLAIPISQKTYANSSELKNKADKTYIENNFVSRSQYGYLDNIEHNADIEAIRTPENADLIYFKYNNRLKELLGVSSFRGMADADTN